MDKNKENEHICWKCRNKMKWAEDLQKWYCPTCNSDFFDPEGDDC